MSFAPTLSETESTEWPTDCLRTLAEIGLAAAWAGHDQEATTILTGVDEALGGHAGTQLGLAVVELNLGRPSAAADRLLAARDRWPDDPAIAPTLAVALKMAGLEQRSQDLGQSLIAAGGETAEVGNAVLAIPPQMAASA